MATSDNGGVSLPDDAAATIQAATAAATSAPAAAPSAAPSVGVSVGVNSMPIDANTWIQITVPANPTAAINAPSISLTLTARILQADGTLAYCRWDETFSLSSGLSFASDMAPGYLLSVAVTCNTAGVVDGMVYAVVGLIHQPGPGRPLDTVLVASYLATASPLAWPAGHLHGISEGNGFLVTIAGTTPAGGANFYYTVVDYYFELKSVQFTLVTGSTAANRQPAVGAGGSTSGAEAVGWYTGTQTASTTMSYNFMVDTAPAAAGPSGWTLCTLSPGIKVPAGGMIEIVVVNIAAGDQLEDIILVAQVWL